MLSRLRSLFHVLQRRRDFEQGMTEELQFHIEQYTKELVSSGVAPQEAARRARIEFGSLNNIRQDCREARGLHLFDELLRELRYAVRLLLKTPGFTATALATLAICLGANLMIFAVVDSILLRPLPFPEADGLVTVFNTYPKGRRRSRWFFPDQLLRKTWAGPRVRRARNLPFWDFDRGSDRRY